MPVGFPEITRKSRENDGCRAPGDPGQPGMPTAVLGVIGKPRTPVVFQGSSRKSRFPTDKQRLSPPPHCGRSREARCV